MLISLLVAPAICADEALIPYELFVLDNGLTLIVHEDHKAPVVSVNIWYHVGSKNEQPGQTGFAHLFEHLMFQGSENFDGEYINSLQQIGATDLNGTTWFDRTNYFQTVPKTALDRVLWLESDRMGHLLGAIDQAKLDEQRGVVQNEKRQGENQPYDKVWQHLLKQLYTDGHPYSWETIGSMKDLEAASLEDVQEWFRTYYGPNNAVLAVAGDVETAKVLERVKHYFGDIPPGPPLVKLEEWVPRHSSERRERIEDRVSQERLYMAWTSPRWGTRAASDLELALHIIGGDKNSRLYKRLVYEDQIATDVEMGAYNLEIAGLTYLQASAKVGVDLAIIEKAAKEEIQRFIDRGPTAKELERVQTQYRASFLRGIERVGGFGGKSGVLAENMVYGGSPDRYQRKLDYIADASRADLQTVVGEWLGENAYIAEVYPHPAMTAAPAGADRSKPPEPAGFPSGEFPEFDRVTLTNGLDILVAQRTAIPLVNLTLILNAGFAADQFAQPGTAAMTMAMLDEGTAKRSALEISEELALLGAELSSGADLDTSMVSLSALRENLDDSLAIFADVVLNPVFPPNELDRLRAQHLALVRQEKTRPTSMALRVLPKLIYGEGHAYAQPLTGSGTEDSIRAITRADLQQYHDTWFRPNNATLLVVGDITTAEITAKLEELFKTWEPADVPVKNIDTVERRAQNAVYIVDKPGAEQSIIFAGEVAPPKSNPDEIAIQVMNDILGGNFSSRINMNLREDKSWSYGARSMIMDAEGQRPFLVYAPVQTDKTSESMREILAELTAINGDRPPTEDELARAKSSKTLSLPGRWETNRAVLRSMGEIVRFGLADDYWDTYADEVNALGIDDIARAASEVVAPDDLVWVVVGDREKIESGIIKLGLGDTRIIDADGEPVSD
ncbi:MAG: pitrilysin family protein [Gammaproteobacteria bacterium]|nr:pitrilysin family protein [Gammaproteobacteria bacterium]